MFGSRFITGSFTAAARRPGQVRLVVWALIGAGLVEALIGDAQWASHHGLCADAHFAPNTRRS